MADVLTLSTAVAVAAVIDAASNGKRVARANDEGEVRYGTARSICANDAGGFVGRGDDVRDGYLHVTLTTGFEVFWPVRELVPEVLAGTFVVSYEP